MSSELSLVSALDDCTMITELWLEFMRIRQEEPEQGLALEACSED